MKYIDAEKLEELISQTEREFTEKSETKGYTTMEYRHKAEGLHLALQYIESLQQEQPVVELEKEVKSYIKDNFTITDEVAQIPEEDRMYSMGQDDMMAFAKHVYELGQLVMEHSITNMAKVALAKCHSFPNTTYFAIGEVLSFILDHTDTEHEKYKTE